jgi:predicted glycosyltransferase
MTTKKYLFYFVHPAKYHLFRVTINKLIADGHLVDIIITGRDILEDLVKNEGWNYTKIFPNGRKIKGLHIYISAGIFLLLTLVKLLWLTRSKNYTLMISDDLTTFVGRMRRIPTFFVTDDDLSAVPESWILMASSSYIFAPYICDLGKYNNKKLGYFGYKSLAHLHPNHFKPNRSLLLGLPNANEKFFFIRTVSATSTHDVGKNGLSDEVLRDIIPLLNQHGRVVLNSERQLPIDLQQYVLDFNKKDVAHYLFFSTLFISDSTTMCAEAAVLGTPALEYDDWYLDFKQYHELNGVYGLLFGYGTNQLDNLKEKISELLSMENLKDEFQKRRSRMLQDKIDVSAFLLWLIECYPLNVNKYFANYEVQEMFKSH